MIERLVLHDDQKLAERMVMKERGYDWEKDCEDDKEKHILNSVNFGKRKCMDLLEDLAREVDMELAEFVAELDGKYPRKQQEQEFEDDNDDAVMPMDEQDLAASTVPRQRHKLGLSDSRCSRSRPQPTWGAAAGAGPAGGGLRQPRLVLQQGATPPIPTTAASPRTPDYCPTPTYEEGSTTPAGGGGGLSPVSPE